MDIKTVKELIEFHPDFPEEGVKFADISPVLSNPEAFAFVVDTMSESVKDVDTLFAIDARGFIFGAAIAYATSKPLILARKPGKLPGATLTEEYDYEYASAGIEIQSDRITKGDTVAVIDDVLATGGTAEAANKLVEKAGGTVLVNLFFLEIDFLKGREKLATNITSLIHI